MNMSVEAGSQAFFHGSFLELPLGFSFHIWYLDVLDPTNGEDYPEIELVMFHTSMGQNNIAINYDGLFKLGCTPK